jgi:putative SOS response-associated peptidase YedK
MCYNKSVLEKQAELEAQYEIFKNLKDHENAFSDLPLFNVTAYHNVPVIGTWEDELRAFKAFWCLIPHWSKTGKPEATAFNARIETIDKSKLFAPYFKSSRCLVPVSAFYEYNAEKPLTIEVNGKKKPAKQPSVIMMKDKKSFMLGGCFSVWTDKKTGELKPSYTVITTEPNKLVGAIHNRMPVIIEEKYFELWLDRSYNDVKELKSIAAKSYPATKMIAHEVNAAYLYDRSHNDKKCWV